MKPVYRWKLIRLVCGHVERMDFVGPANSWPSGWSWAGRRVK